MQTINTKHFGPISFIKTWVASDGRHVGKLSKGGYAHLSGSPVTAKKDLTDLISGQDRKDAVEWFDHKDEPKSKIVTKRITLLPDGGYEWENGSPILDAADIYNTLPKGAQLDAVLDWFSRSQRLKKTKEKMIRSGEKRTTERLKKETEEKIENDRKVA